MTSLNEMNEIIGAGMDEMGSDDKDIVFKLFNRSKIENKEEKREEFEKLCRIKCIGDVEIGKAQLPKFGPDPMLLPFAEDLEFEDDDERSEFLSAIYLFMGKRIDGKKEALEVANMLKRKIGDPLFDKIIEDINKVDGDDIENPENYLDLFTISMEPILNRQCIRLFEYLDSTLIPLK